MSSMIPIVLSPTNRSTSCAQCSLLCDRSSWQSDLSAGILRRFRQCHLDRTRKCHRHADGLYEARSTIPQRTSPSTARSRPTMVETLDTASLPHMGPQQTPRPLMGSHHPRRSAVTSLRTADDTVISTCRCTGSLWLARRRDEVWGDWELG